MEINRWIPNCVTEKLLTSFQKRILQKVHEPTKKKTDLHEALKMDSFSNPYGDSISEEETSFITNVESYDIFSSELKNTVQSKTIKNNILTPVSQQANKVQSTITSSVSVSGNDPEQSRQSNGIVREKCVKIKIIVPKKQSYSPILAQNNYYAKSSDNSVGKIVEDLVLERYKHFFEYYENKKRQRNKRKIKFDDTTETETKNVSFQNTEVCYDSPLKEEVRQSKSLDNLDHVYSSPKLSQDYSVSDCDISELLITKHTTTTETNSLSTCPTYTSIPVLHNPEEKEIGVEDHGNKKGAIQDKIIQQIITVVEFCKLNRNLQGYIEAERLLLLANYERNLIYKPDPEPRPDLPTTGIVTILNISLSADEQDLFITAPSKIYYVCLLTYNKSIVSSGTSMSDLEGKIRFDKEITVKNLSPDFVLEGSLYALRLPECFQYRGRNVFSPSHLKHISPRRLFIPGQIIPDQKKSKSSFCLVGTFNMSIEDVGRVKHISIRNMIPEFVVLSQGKLQMQCDVLDIGHPIFSFVNVGFRIGDNSIRWNRLWGTIGKMDIKFWKYPYDNPECPVVTINLKSCMDKAVTNVDHQICLRPRTLQLEVEETGDYHQTIMFLLSFDSLDDMIEWKDQLNSLIPWIKKM